MLVEKKKKGKVFQDKDTGICHQWSKFHSIRKQDYEKYRYSASDIIIIITIETLSNLSFDLEHFEFSY